MNKTAKTTVKFRAYVSESGWLYSTKWIATLNSDHVVTKDKYGYSGGSNRVTCRFTCTCGWTAQTASGTSNSYVEMHARNIAKEAN